MKNVKSFCDNPVAFYGYSVTRLQNQDRNEYEELQLKGLQHRFKQFRDQIPLLKKLADKQGINAIETLDDVVPLLFDQSMFRSYPPSLLDKGRFDHMTQWLNKLTTFDISGLDTSDCHSIDDWLIKLGNETPLLVTHTPSNSGSFSFIPHAREDMRDMVAMYPITHFQQFGHDEGKKELPLDMDAVYPYYRYGNLSHVALNEVVAEVICGEEERLYTAFPDRLSSDVMRLAALLQSAKAKGQSVDDLNISPEIMARREAFMARQANMPEYLDRFFANISNKLRGHRIFLFTTASMIYKMATDARAQGHKNLFAKDSAILVGGSSAGLPEDWQDVVKEVLGVGHININYGMVEMSTIFPLCEHGRYHLMPWIVPFQLDPDTNQPLPRRGEVTGRFAFYDLFPKSRWGGYISDDEVTIDWDSSCDCGRKTPHMSPEITPYSQKQDDDKISCAASPNAYEEAMDFLADFEI